jgi:hypothetical protein
VKEKITPPPPHYIFNLAKTFLRKSPALWKIGNLIRNAGIIPGTWTTAHVNNLIRKRYTPEHSINKIAFIINVDYAMEHFDNIFLYLDSNEYNLVYMGPSCAAMCMQYALKRHCSVVFAKEVVRRKLCYKLAIAMFGDTLDMKFGIEFLAQKTMLITTLIDYPYVSKPNMQYHYIVCCGKNQKKTFENFIKNANLFVLGSPRFEKYDSDIETAKQIIITHTGHSIDCSKKTILWLPTHTGTHNKSSVFLNFLPVMSRLQNKYNIIIKPHLFLYYEMSNVIENILSMLPKAIILNDISNNKLFPIADYVICDYGGVVFSAIKVDKNVLFFNADDESITLDWTPLANILRDRIANFYVNEEEKFFAALKDDSVWEKQKEIRRQIRAEFFADNPNPARDIAELCRRIVRGAA